MYHFVDSHLAIVCFGGFTVLGEHWRPVLNCLGLLLAIKKQHDLEQILRGGAVVQTLIYTYSGDHVHT